MADNKIELADGTVLIDLTSDTVTPQTMVRGITAHDASGESVTGVVDLAYAGDATPLADGIATAGVSDDYAREDHVHPTDPTIATKYTKPVTGIPFTDLADDAKMVILSYGTSTWADFEAAYTTNRVIYCRASSGSNPASGSQTRLAFMAYVNNAASPTEVEFQYYRSLTSHSLQTQGDMIYVYKLTKASGWSITLRNTYTKVLTGTGLKCSYNTTSGILTISDSSSYIFACASSSDAGAKIASSNLKGIAPNSYFLLYLENPNTYNGAITLKLDCDSTVNIGPYPLIVNGTVTSESWTPEIPAGKYLVWFEESNGNHTFSIRTDGILPADISGNAGTVNNHTVYSDVPANAVFTDTTYSNATTSAAGLMSATDKTAVDLFSSLGLVYDSDI